MKFIKIRDPNAERWVKWIDHCANVGTRWEVRTLDGFEFQVLVPLIPFIEEK